MSIHLRAPRAGGGLSFGRAATRRPLRDGLLDLFALLERILSDGRELTIATSYPRFARGYFSRQGIPTEIIRLTGSVELAPVLGLAPCIVDIVETGATLAARPGGHRADGADGGLLDRQSRLL